jgi:hypothetical protein
MSVNMDVRLINNTLYDTRELEKQIGRAHV